MNIGKITGTIHRADRERVVIKTRISAVHVLVGPEIEEKYLGELSADQGKPGSIWAKKGQDGKLWLMNQGKLRPMYAPPAGRRRA